MQVSHSAGIYNVIGKKRSGHIAGIAGKDGILPYNSAYLLKETSLNVFNLNNGLNYKIRVRGSCLQGIKYIETADPKTPNNN